MTYVDDSDAQIQDLRNRASSAIEAQPAKAQEIKRQLKNMIAKIRRQSRQEQSAVDRQELICTFTSFDQWVIHARSWLGGISGGGVRYKRRERCVCIDTKGRICRIGKDFMRAHDEGAFPIKAYRK